MMTAHRVARRSGPPGEYEGLTPGGRTRSGSGRTTSRGMIRSSADGASRLQASRERSRKAEGTGTPRVPPKTELGNWGGRRHSGNAEPACRGGRTGKRAHPPELAPTGEMLNEPRVTPEDRSAVDHPTRAALGGAPSPPTAAQPRAVAVFARVRPGRPRVPCQPQPQPQPCAGFDISCGRSRTGAGAFATVRAFRHPVWTIALGCRAPAWPTFRRRVRSSPCSGRRGRSQRRCRPRRWRW